ncbi:MAG: hypothetical protein AAF997_12175 [Myxococcota bacterium]
MERVRTRALVNMGLLLLGVGCQAPAEIGAGGSGGSDPLGGSGGSNPAQGGSGGIDPNEGPGDLEVIDDSLLSACFRDAMPVSKEEACADHWCAEIDGRTLVSVEATTLPELSIEGRVTIRPRDVRAFQGGSIALDGQALEVFDASRELIGSVGLAGIAVSMEVIGTTAFVVTSSCGRGDIQTVDLSNPTKPRVTSRWSWLEPIRERAFLDIVGRTSSMLVIRSQRIVAFIDVSTPEAPQVSRLAPWPFENGWVWRVVVNDQFLVMAGTVGNRQPMAFVFPLDSDVVHELEIQQESTPVLYEDLLVILTPTDGVRIMRLDPSNTPEVLTEIPLSFLRRRPPLHAGFAFLQNELVVDLRDPAFSTYRLIGSLEDDCAVKLYDEAGDPRVGLAPLLLPDQRIPPEDLPSQDCGVAQFFDILVESTGTQALAKQGGGSSLVRVQPDVLEPLPFMVLGQVVAWAEGRLLTLQRQGFDFSQARTDTFRVYADDGGETPIVELAPPGPLIAIAHHGRRAAILVEPAPRDFEGPEAPVAERRLLLLDFTHPNPAFRRIDVPENTALLRVAIDADATFAVSARGELHRWPHDGTATSKIAFVSDDVGRLVATPFGVFAETRTGFHQTDGVAVRRVAPPSPSALIVGHYGENLLWYVPRSQAHVLPEDDLIVLASPVMTEAMVDMSPTAAVGVWESAAFGGAELFAVGPPGLTFYAEP